MTITERHLNGVIIFQTFDLIASPFILGVSKLGYSALGQAGDEGVWKDWTATATTISIHRGLRREGITLTNEIGLATITLHDPGNALDPTTGIHPNQPGRVMLRLPGQPDQPLFTGQIHDARRGLTNTPDGRVPVLTIVLADAVRDHNNTTRYGAAGPERFADRVNRLRASTPLPVETPPENPTTLQTRLVYESSLANHFTLAANTAGALWYVGADGITRFQYRAIASATDAGLLSDAHVINVDAGSGLDGWANRVYVNAKAATPDPDNPGQWLATETILEMFTDPASIGRWGERSDIYDVAWESTDADDFPDAVIRMRGPYTDPTDAITRATINAQYNLYNVPRYEIGAAVTLAVTGYPSQAALITGVHHTITPTRWLIDLDLIGA